MPPTALCLVTFFFLAAACSASAQVLGPVPATAQGKDDATATEYAVFTIPAEALPLKAGDPPPDPSTAASLTIQCSQVRGHRKIDLFFNPTGGPVTSLRSLDTGPGTIPNPNAKVTLDMDGAKSFKLVWEILPSGEYHYRNPGSSSNLLTPLFLMQWMYSTRITRFRVPGIATVPEFHDSNLVAAAYQSPLCKP
jgi:hypothetical protein